jgi:hypothetical protein
MLKLKQKCQVRRVQIDCSLTLVLSCFCGVFVSRSGIEDTLPWVAPNGAAALAQQRAGAQP